MCEPSASTNTVTGHLMWGMAARIAAPLPRPSSLRTSAPASAATSRVQVDRLAVHDDDLPSKAAATGHDVPHRTRLILCRDHDGDVQAHALAYFAALIASGRSMLPRIDWYASHAVQHCGHEPFQISACIRFAVSLSQIGRRSMLVPRRSPIGVEYEMQGYTIPCGSMKQLDRSA